MTELLIVISLPRVLGGKEQKAQELVLLLECLRSIYLQFAGT